MAERVWIAGTVAVGVSLVDFLDPALAGGDDVRERGVRLEVRRVQERAPGSIYSSPELVLEPAVLRVDLLESRPGAADRMHWHPAMSDGEPDDRAFDPAIPRDPVAWTRRLLADLDAHLGTGAAAAVAGVVDDVLAAVTQLLDRAREPWPTVSHDARGLAR